MQKLAKKLSVFVAVIMTMSIMLNFVMAAPAKAATVYPQVQYAQEPQLEYTVGDRVQFNLFTPNYGGRVQYRVVLWQDETKSYKDLWTTTPDRYYDKWMPYGNNIFTLGWIINEPGHYRITIYAKRAGVPNNDTYLKGFNCDSYMESDSFVVKAKEVAEEEPKPDIASEKIELASVTSSAAAINGHISKSVQSIIGKDYELAVKVDKPGVKVMFQLDAPDGSLNKDEVLEAVSGSDNVAKVSYKRLYADADYVTAYVAAAPTVRTAMKVYWGVDKILDIKATDEDAANAGNGNVKSYKVTLKNPITGEKMRDREVLVLIRENIDAPSNAALSTALIVNPYSGIKRGTYQRMNNIVNGGLNQETVTLTTNDNGEAVFTVTGINTKATPVVFFDDNWFYGRPDDYAWGGLSDSSQYKPSYSGNDNDRWDATELQVEPAAVSFNADTYTFEQTAITDPYAAADTNITEVIKIDEIEYTVFKYRSGKTYTVTVKDAAGKPYNKGLVNIAINEYIDGVYGTNTNARIVGLGTTSTNMKRLDDPNINNQVNLKDGLGYYKIQATTSASGVVMFRIASDRVNDMGTPIIWVDQDNASPLTGTRNGILEPADPQKLLSQTTFVESAINSAAFSAALVNSNLEMSVDENDDVISIDGEPVRFTYKVRNQNGSVFMPAGAMYANLTYTIVNNGNSPLKVKAPVSGLIPSGGQYVTVDGYIGNYTEVIIPTHQTKTISFRTAKADGNYIDIVANGSAAVSVTANANIVTETNTADGWLAPKTAVASWVSTTAVEDYTVKTLFSSTVFGYNLVENYVIAEPITDEGTYVKIPYDVNDVYTVSTQQHQPTLDADIVEFENQITTEDGLTFRFGNVNYISLYNADNSYDDEATDEDVPPAPVLDITSVVTREGAEKVVTYAQETTLFVESGTETSMVGYFVFGDKVFNPSAGMTTVQIAQMIENASPITIGGVAFDVEMVSVEIDGTTVSGGLKFTAALAPVEGLAPTPIDVWSSFNANGTGVAIEEVTDYLDDLITNTVDAVAEEITLTVNTACPTTRTLQVTLKNGNEVFQTTLVNLLAGDNASVVAQKIYNALDYDFAFEDYDLTLEGNQVIITKLLTGPADLKVIIE
jgi:hypothetical protein